METKLKRIMAKKGIRQADLARISKIDSSRINRYVNGCCFPNSATLLRISIALNCDPAELQEKGGGK